MTITSSVQGHEKYKGAEDLWAKILREYQFADGRSNVDIKVCQPRESRLATALHRGFFRAQDKWRNMQQKKKAPMRRQHR